jgi:hypothetical protein
MRAAVESRCGEPLWRAAVESRCGEPLWSAAVEHVSNVPWGTFPRAATPARRARTLARRASQGAPGTRLAPCGQLAPQLDGISLQAAGNSQRELPTLSAPARHQGRHKSPKRLRGATQTERAARMAERRRSHRRPIFQPKSCQDGRARLLPSRIRPRLVAQDSGSAGPSPSRTGPPPIPSRSPAVARWPARAGRASSGRAA